MKTKESKRTKRIKAYSRRAFKIICKELRLHDVKLTFNNSKRIHFNNRGLNININCIDLMGFCEIGYKSHHYFITKYNINSVKQRVYFIIGHELSHYLHYTRYYKSFYRGFVEYSRLKNRCTEKEYRQLKLEKKADNLSMALINRLWEK